MVPAAMASPASRFSALWVVALLTATVVAILVAERFRVVGPPVSVTYLGLSGGGIHRNPYGTFLITNHTGRTVHFSALVEAPLDPGLPVSQNLSSMLDMGEIPPHRTARTEPLVAGKRGVPFRISIDCQYAAGFPVTTWLWLCARVPALWRLWGPSRVLPKVHTVQGDWCVAQEDFRGPGHAVEAPR